MPKLVEVWEAQELSPEDSIIKVALGNRSYDGIPVFIGDEVVGNAYCPTMVKNKLFALIMLFEQYKYLNPYLETLNFVTEVNINNVLEPYGLKAIHLYEHIRL